MGFPGKPTLKLRLECREVAGESSWELHQGRVKAAGLARGRSGTLLLSQDTLHKDSDLGIADSLNLRIQPSLELCCPSN